MGNCCIKKHVMKSWADDDYESEDEEYGCSGTNDVGGLEERQRLLSDTPSVVKIKLNKKEFEEMFSRDKDIEKILSRLVSSRATMYNQNDHYHNHHHHDDHHWRPALQSIPETI